MGDLEVIRAMVEKVARRRRWRRAWKGAWNGLMVGACVWLAGVVCYKLLPIPGLSLAWAGILSVLVVPAGWFWGWRRVETLAMAARWIDAREQLQQRLSTAWELAEEDRSGPWRELLVADVARRLERVDWKRGLAFRVPTCAIRVVLVLAVAAGLGFVPEYRSRKFSESRAAAENTKAAGERLAELTARQLEARPPALEETRDLLERVEELGLRVGKLELGRDEALRELSAVSERLREELSAMGRRPGLRRLETGDRSSAEGVNADELRRQAERIEQQLGQQSTDPRAAEALSRDLEALRQAAANLASEDSAARAELAQRMSALAQAAEELGIELGQMESAIEALRAGDLDRMLRDLRMATMDLEQLARMARSLEQLQAQLAEIGRDLPEQLERGQGQPAIHTLEQMRERLQRGDLTDAELREMISEVSRAIAPGNDYGRVGELLAAAAGELTNQERDRAAESLGAAAEELRRLLDQLGDGAELMAALDNLQTAQMCIGDGQAWSLSRNRGGGFRPGGRPGSGVGTWAEEGVALGEVEPTGLWDNSGVQRPDLEPRGGTDRGAGQLSGALEPTQVRGQINPEGAMPAVTLRGLSVRGQSRVTYREAVTAAQSEARSALSQERVPRAYQGAVREYFDDLRE